MIRSFVVLLAFAAFPSSAQPGDVFHTLSGRALALPSLPASLSPVTYEMDGQTLGLADYQRRQAVAGLLILKNGRIAYEYYAGGNTDKTLWTSRAVANSVVSIMIGIAIKEGFIGSVDDPATQYLPELTGTAWSGVTLRQLLQNTGGAWLVGRLLERATHMTIAHYLETRLWSRFAMEQDGVWEDRVHGFNATLRDWGRFGLFVAQGGKLPTGEQLLPADWLTQSTSWTKASGAVTPQRPSGQFGYQWWYGGVDPTRSGAKAVFKTAQHSLWAEGIYGQAIAINPTQKLVMVQWSTWKEADAPAALYDEQALFFTAVARSLAQSP